jgi:hypothetical protein
VRAQLKRKGRIIGTPLNKTPVKTAGSGLQKPGNISLNEGGTKQMYETAKSQTPAHML